MAPPEFNHEPGQDDPADAVSAIASTGLGSTGQTDGCVGQSYGKVASQESNTQRLRTSLANASQTWFTAQRGEQAER